MRCELATRVRTTTFCLRPQAHRAISVMLLGLLVSPTSFAQQAGSTNQPDAPSATKNQEAHKDDPLQVTNLLSGKSLMFPNLAVNNERLTPRQKFLLAANNSVSGITFIGTAAGEQKQSDDRRIVVGAGGRRPYRLELGVGQHPLA